MVGNDSMVQLSVHAQATSVEVSSCDDGETCHGCQQPPKTPFRFRRFQNL